MLADEVVDKSLRLGTRLRVWAAACSTGEEPFTLEMLLLDGRRIPPSMVTLKASDLSLKALDKAATGFCRELRYGRERTHHPKCWRPVAG